MKIKTRHSLATSVRKFLLSAPSFLLFLFSLNLFPFSVFDEFAFANQGPSNEKSDLTLTNEQKEALQLLEEIKSESSTFQWKFWLSYKLLSSLSAERPNLPAADLVSSIEESTQTYIKYAFEHHISSSLFDYLNPLLAQVEEQKLQTQSLHDEEEVKDIWPESFKKIKNLVFESLAHNVQLIEDLKSMYLLNNAAEAKRLEAETNSAQQQSEGSEDYKNLKKENLRKALIVTSSLYMKESQFIVSLFSHQPHDWQESELRQLLQLLRFDPAQQLVLCSRLPWPDQSKLFMKILTESEDPHNFLKSSDFYSFTSTEPYPTWMKAHNKPLMRFTGHENWSELMIQSLKGYFFEPQKPNRIWLLMESPFINQEKIRSTVLSPEQLIFWMNPSLENRIAYAWTNQKLTKQLEKQKAARKANTRQSSQKTTSSDVLSYLSSTYSNSAIDIQKYWDDSYQEYNEKVGLVFRSTVLALLQSEVQKPSAQFGLLRAIVKAVGQFYPEDEELRSLMLALRKKRGIQNFPVGFTHKDILDRQILMTLKPEEYFHNLIDALPAMSRWDEKSEHSADVSPYLWTGLHQVPSVATRFENYVYKSIREEIFYSAHFLSMLKDDSLLLRNLLKALEGQPYTRHLILIHPRLQSWPERKLWLMRNLHVISQNNYHKPNGIFRRKKSPVWVLDVPQDVENILREGLIHLFFTMEAFPFAADGSPIPKSWTEREKLSLYEILHNERNYPLLRLYFELAPDFQMFPDLDTPANFMHRLGAEEGIANLMDSRSAWIQQVREHGLNLPFWFWTTKPSLLKSSGDEILLAIDQVRNIKRQQLTGQIILNENILFQSVGLHPDINDDQLRSGSTEALKNLACSSILDKSLE